MRFAPKRMMLGLTLLLLVGVACKEQKKEVVSEEKETAKVEVQDAKPFFKLSLAQWSMHNMVWKEKQDPYEFAGRAKAWGFSGLEYVSGLYYEELKKDDFSEASMANFVAKSNAEAKKHGMTNLLIMIDGQGDLATKDAAERKAAVENHFKWVDAAAAMGCHTIRVNLSGSKEVEEWTAASVDGLTQLATYAKDKNINITVENHGGLSSNAGYLAAVMAKVNMDNCGTLPDFGNFCMKSDESGCTEKYDMYKGVTELMPYAKAVSAKTHDFDETGEETDIDYTKMLQIVKDAGYTGFIGVEYEGTILGEEEGIIASRDLLLNSAKKVK